MPLVADASPRHLPRLFSCPAIMGISAVAFIGAQVSWRSSRDGAERQRIAAAMLASLSDLDRCPAEPHAEWPQNNPLYLRSMEPATDDQYIKLHYTVHCSLDAVEEKGARVPATHRTGTQPTFQLGHKRHLQSMHK